MNFKKKILPKEETIIFFTMNFENLSQEENLKISQIFFNLL